MKKQHVPNQIIAIYANDKKGLVGHVLMIFNRSNCPVHQLNVSRTDINDLVLITLEVSFPKSMLLGLLKKVEKIIEVHSAKSFTAKEAWHNFIGHYRIAKDCLEARLFRILQTNGAVISHVFEDSLIIQKIGSEADLNAFYCKLEGPHLMSFAQSALVIPESLKELDTLTMEFQ